jgi:hypothetical protein
LAGQVIELIAMHGANQRDVIGMPAQMWKQVRHIHSAFSVFLKSAGTAEKARRFFLREGKFHPLEERVGHRLSVELVQLWFGIEEIHLAGTALHEEVDAAFCLGSKVGCPD